LDRMFRNYRRVRDRHRTSCVDPARGGDLPERALTLASVLRRHPGHLHAALSAAGPFFHVTPSAAPAIMEAATAAFTAGLHPSVGLNISFPTSLRLTRTNEWSTPSAILRAQCDVRELCVAPFFIGHDARRLRHARRADGSAAHWCEPAGRAACRYPVNSKFGGGPPRLDQLPLLRTS